jgi:hypothetical protein
VGFCISFLFSTFSFQAQYWAKAQIEVKDVAISLPTYSDVLQDRSLSDTRPWLLEVYNRSIIRQLTNLLELPERRLIYSRSHGCGSLRWAVRRPCFVSRSCLFGL